jgi:hypothetical protein
MRKQNKKRLQKFDSDYIIQMIVIGIFLIGCSCMLIFYVRVFNRWDKAPVILIEGDYVTYLVNNEEYVNKVSFKTNEGLHPSGDGVDRRPYEIGELYIDYQVSNPNYVMSNRTLPLILFSGMEVLIGGIIVTLTVLEFKRRARM